MKALVFGKNGQLGQALKQCSDKSLHPIFLGRSECDLNDPGAISEIVFKYAPDVVINAAAYTAVDRAESEKDAAYRINGEAVKQMARACAECKARLIHVSTDFVFSGKTCRPYGVDEEPAPISVYGASKLAGETAVQSTAGLDWVVVRTAWVYSTHGANFVKTMLRLMAEKDSLGVVSDQVGTPTWTTTLASALWMIAQTPVVEGVHHWTDAGVASWYDFAVAIQEEALELGLLKKRVEIRPIRTEDYPTPAHRPAYSVLDKTRTWSELGMCAPHWRESLRNMLKEVADA